MRAFLVGVGLCAIVISGAPALAAEPADYKPIVECKAALFVFRQVRQIPDRNFWEISSELNNASYRINERSGMSWEKSSEKLNVDSALLYYNWRLRVKGSQFINLANKNFQSCVTAMPDSVGLLKWR